MGNLAHSLTKDQLNVQAYKRARDSKPTSILQSIRDEQTLVTSVSVVNNEMYVIEAHVQVIDKTAKVYKSLYSMIGIVRQIIKTAQTCFTPC